MQALKDYPPKHKPLLGGGFKFPDSLLEKLDASVALSLLEKVQLPAPVGPAFRTAVQAAKSSTTVSGRSFGYGMPPGPPPPFAPVQPMPGMPFPGMIPNNGQNGMQPFAPPPQIPSVNGFYGASAPPFPSNMPSFNPGLAAMVSGQIMIPSNIHNAANMAMPFTQRPGPGSPSEPTQDTARFPSAENSVQMTIPQGARGASQAAQGQQLTPQGAQVQARGAYGNRGMPGNGMMPGNGSVPGANSAADLPDLSGLMMGLMSKVDSATLMELMEEFVASMPETLQTVIAPALQILEAKNQAIAAKADGVLTEVVAGANFGNPAGYPQGVQPPKQPNVVGIPIEHQDSEDLGKRNSESPEVGSPQVVKKSFFSSIPPEAWLGMLVGACGIATLIIMGTMNYSDDCGCTCAAV
mmetsp:Transcript_49476/g.100982  ORF Transcript_49476/g.100982 Transcript_49476/m.100982 type:complete len:409 (+) Transcript_49476:1-1227(+)